MAGPEAARAGTLWEGGRRPRRRAWRANVAIGASIAVHAALGWYVYETKFRPVYRVYDDGAVTVDIYKPAPKPPEPPPEQKAPEPLPPPPAPETPLTPHVAEVPPLPGITPPPPVVLPAPEPPPPPAPPAAQAPPAPPAPPVITNPDWSQRPSGEDMARFYPERAQRLAIEGRATLQCQVTAKGAVTGCAVTAEDPSGNGFGEAALRLSRLFRMKPATQGGQAVEGAVVRIPISFRID